MKFLIHYRNHHPSRSFSELVAGQIELFRAELQIDEARVLIELRSDASPAFRVTAHLVTPGPDIQVEAVDHTLRAAQAKMIRQIDKKICHRSAKRVRRIRSNLQAPASTRFPVAARRT